MTKKIDLENHFASEAWVDALLKNEGLPRLRRDPDSTYTMDAAPGVSLPYRVLDTLLDLGEGRIALLDRAGIDVAVLSLAAPGTEPFEPTLGAKVARVTNDALAEAIDKHPDRFQGFATLAPKDADSAAKELERAVKELGFKGWNTHSNFGDSFIDEKRYWPVLAKAEELGVPIYLHPTYSIVPQFQTYGIGLAGPSFGFGAETAMVMMRLITGGVFDVFPKLKIILGHYAEGLPFMLDRVDRAYIQGHVRTDPAIAPPLKRMPSDYLRDNMVASTSGNYLPAAVVCTRTTLGSRRMVIGSDHPFESMDQCMNFLEAQPMSGEEREDLYWRTAASLGIGA
ncbi:MAG: amidohydrolase family protein [Actinobacteria bacterium]|nr:amidohydrolase family protein [Actinomycetota bacterium]